MAAPPPEEWTSLSKINQELEAILAKLPSTQFITEKTNIEDLRKLSSRAEPTEPWPEVLEQDLQIPARDGFTNRARIYSPSERLEGGRPLLVMVHGGGYCMGRLEMEEPNCRSWSKKFGGVAVSIEHRKGPEFPFPQAVHDIYDSIKWIAANYKSFDAGADPSKGFILGGISSGASSIAVISHLWRDENLQPSLTGLYLSIPAPCIVSALPEKYKPLEHAWEQNKDAPLFNREASDFLAKLYHPDPTSPLRSALLFETGHANLPPTYFVIAGADIWRDVGLIYEKVLREEGVKTRVDLFPGLPHGFWSMFREAEFAREHAERSEEGFGWLLKEGVRG